ncbi:hypothetical protein VP01_35g5 [Puccinia sorghi]|uniref:Uncharacterized protein n=1 Tax=Puccinia sorghi TaxID=27349 RepID=A0A0L6UV24_9BASI|nr:hypothetical protein VP01_35g5 [Puccinia sorghi]
MVFINLPVSPYPSPCQMRCSVFSSFISSSFFFVCRYIWISVDRSGLYMPEWTTVSFYHHYLHTYIKKKCYELSKEASVGGARCVQGTHVLLPVRLLRRAGMCGHADTYLVGWIRPVHGGPFQFSQQTWPMYLLFPLPSLQKRKNSTVLFFTLLKAKMHITNWSCQIHGSICWNLFFFYSSLNSLLPSPSSISLLIIPVSVAYEPVSVSYSQSILVLRNGVIDCFFCDVIHVYIGSIDTRNFIIGSFLLFPPVELVQESDKKSNIIRVQHCMHSVWEQLSCGANDFNHCLDSGPGDIKSVCKPKERLGSSSAPAVFKKHNLLFQPMPISLPSHPQAYHHHHCQNYLHQGWFHFYYNFWSPHQQIIPLPKKIPPCLLTWMDGIYIYHGTRIPSLPNTPFCLDMTSIYSTGVLKKQNMVFFPFSTVKSTCPLVCLISSVVKYGR